jgi:hypothetical protein
MDEKTSKVERQMSNVGCRQVETVERKNARIEIRRPERVKKIVRKILVEENIDQYKTIRNRDTPWALNTRAGED